jgi:hypothetical protein
MKAEGLRVLVAGRSGRFSCVADALLKVCGCSLLVARDACHAWRSPAGSAAAPIAFRAAG